MKQSFAYFAFIVTAIILSNVTLSKADDFTIRGLKWGASAEEVKAADKSTFKREAASGAVKFLVYSDSYLGEPVSVVYRLIHGKLFQVSYQFESNGRKCAELTKKFDEAVSDFTAKHGAPAAGLPGAACNTQKEWNIDGTELSVDLSSQSGRTDLAVNCRSKELEKLAEGVSVTTEVVTEQHGS